MIKRAYRREQKGALSEEEEKKGENEAEEETEGAAHKDEYE